MRDLGTQNKLREEQQYLYAEDGVGPYVDYLLLLMQIPVLMVLWQPISHVPELKQGYFLQLNLGNVGPTLILSTLAAIFTFASTYLSNTSQVELNALMKITNFMILVVTLVIGTNLASSFSLYWVVSNAFQVVQTLLIDNPFRIRKGRKEEARRIHERERALKKVMNPKKKRE